MRYNQILNKTINKYNNLVLKEEKAYHGSPYDFDEFDVKFIGQGEGAQAHGWGLYFALLPDVAFSYNSKLFSEKSYLEYQNKIYSEKSIAYIILNYLKNNQLGRAENFLNELKNDEKFIKKYPKYLKLVDVFLNKLQYINPKDIKKRGGQIYKVEIPDLQYFLDEDLRFEAQTDFIKEKILEIYNEYEDLDPQYLEDAKGEQIYNAIKNRIFNGNSQQASELLLSKGIVGIKYYGSIDRDCVVLFSGKNVSIIKKYNQVKKNQLKQIILLR